eukprot:TRINITY_DN4676_c0_g1_i4.p1 TRINITY_DN4676_c0_g1~~TRINITY_DN4676_c0_g1_i4.p1  ORF type:complete len:211 (-),score=36.81 TRINITY_DN4676_c0_g1_i4:106-657(-)
MDVWNNNWSHVHDFTPIQGQSHWNFLEPNVRASALLKTASQVSQQHSAEEDEMDSVVPLTSGLRTYPPHFQVAFVLVHDEDFAFQLIKQLAPQVESGAVSLRRTRSSRLSKDSLNRLVGQQAPTKPFTNSILQGVAIGLELVGADIHNVLSPFINPDHAFVSAPSTSASAADLFIVQMKPEIF